MTNKWSYYNDVDPQACAWLRELMRDGLIPEGEIDGRSIKEVQATDVVAFRQCHFFAGVAGWSEALRLAGWDASRPVWTGSCPCQPYSSAGKRKGSKDARNLWPDFFKLIRECRPPVVFGEQVASGDVVGTELEAAFVSAVQRGDAARANRLAERIAKRHGGEALEELAPSWIDGVRADLEGEGYTFWFQVLGAHSAGADHVRQRVFWVADAGHGQRWRPDECQPRTADAAERNKAAVDPERRRSPRGVGDTAIKGPLPAALAGLLGEEAGGAQQRGRDGRRPAGPSGTHLGVGNADAGGRPEGDAVPQRPATGAGVPGTPDSGVEHPDGAGRPQRRGSVAVEPEQPTAECACTFSGAVWDAWGDLQLVHCRDNKWRRVPRIPAEFESCFFPVFNGFSAGVDDVRLACETRFPLAKKVPNRVMLLRGAGNAICVQTAASFIRAFMDVQEATA